MKKSGQVWIETVLYTLIGLALIGLALGFITPKINQERDRLLVEQTINSLSEFDEKISETIQKGAGNVRQIEFYMRKGELRINGINNSIQFALTGLSSPYSEPGVEISAGRIKLVSIQGQKTSEVRFTLLYSSNITYADKEEDKIFTPSSTPYKFSIENKGVYGPSASPTIWINIEEISSR